MGAQVVGALPFNHQVGCSVFIALNYSCRFYMLQFNILHSIYKFYFIIVCDLYVNKNKACPTNVLEMIPWDGCKAKLIAYAPRTEDCVGYKKCESACQMDFFKRDSVFTKNF